MFLNIKISLNNCFLNFYNEKGELLSNSSIGFFKRAFFKNTTFRINFKALNLLIKDLHRKISKKLSLKFCEFFMYYNGDSFFFSHFVYHLIIKQKLKFNYIFFIKKKSHNGCRLKKKRRKKKRKRS